MTVWVPFLLGATLGTWGDWFHVVSSTTAYPAGVSAFYLGKQPYWVPLLFGTAALAISLSHPFTDRILKASAQRPGSRSLGAVVVGIVVFLAIYAMSSFLPLKTGGSLDFVLAGSALLAWYALDRRFEGLLLAASTALVGCAVEIFMVKGGYFSYLPPKNNFFGVASWLPWLYVAASVGVGNLGRYLQARSSAKSPASALA